MPKKQGTKEGTAKPLNRNAVELNEILIENFVSLQKTMTNLAIKFDNLSENISKLLQLFEMSARSFAEKQPVQDLEKDKEFLGKLNALLEQNKTIAKGLTLMEEKMRERVYGNEERPELPQRIPGLPNIPGMMPQQRQTMQPSITESSENKQGFKKLPRT